MLEVPCDTCIIKTNCTQVCDKLENLKTLLNQGMNHNRFHTHVKKYKDMYNSYALQYHEIMHLITSIEFRGVRLKTMS